jgi:hypothetical protein
MSAEWFERNAKIAESGGFVELAERFREKKRSWHTWAMENWDKVGWSHHGGGGNRRQVNGRLCRTGRQALG